MDLISYDIDTSLLTLSDKPPSLSIPDDYLLFDAEIPETSTSFNIEVHNIDPALVKIDEIGVNFLIELSFNFTGLDAILNSIEIHDLSIQLPKGLKATASDQGIYDPSTGKLSYSNLIISDKTLRKGLILSVSKIDTEQAGLKLANGKLLLETICSLSGKLAIYGRNLKQPIDINRLLSLKQITYQLEVNFPNGDIELTDFTGDVRYQFNGINASPIIIEDVPNLLLQVGTDIRIVNPQI